MTETLKRAILRVQATLERAMRALEDSRPELAWIHIREAQISLARFDGNAMLAKDWEDSQPACFHGVEIGKKCKPCRGIVGGKGPRPAPGQIWRGRGQHHAYIIMDPPIEVLGTEMVVLYSIDHQSHEIGELHMIGAHRHGVRWSVADLADEFWFWGSPVEAADRVAS